jgi:hypothetical protein
MGVDGWAVLNANVTVKGTVAAVEWGGSHNWINLNKDGDWSLFIRPGLASAKYADNSSGVTNAPTKGLVAGLIECEILPRDASQQLFNELFIPLGALLGTKPIPVTAVGVWVEDLSHDDKTELHPLQSVVAEVAANATSREFRVYALSDASSFHLPYRPKPVPYAGESYTATFQATFPPKPAGASRPVVHCEELPCTRAEGPLAVHVDESTSPPRAVGSVTTGSPHNGKGLYAAVMTLRWE